MVSVGNGGHSVDLKVLVGSNVRCCLNRSPVSEGWLSIVEPLVGKSLQLMVVNVSNSLGNFASWNSSADAHDLLSDLLVKSLSSFVGK
jgi:hypothetical protein